MRWFAKHRQEWIAETLRVFGFINRVHLERKFGVSTAQAAVDLRDFRSAHPDAMTYDPSSKRYVANTEADQTASQEGDSPSGPMAGSERGDNVADTASDTQS